MLPPPVFHSESKKWEDWSWQLKSYVSMYKPVAQSLMDRLEGTYDACIDQHLEDFEVANCPNQRLVDSADSRTISLHKSQMAPPGSIV